MKETHAKFLLSPTLVFVLSAASCIASDKPLPADHSPEDAAQVAGPASQGEAPVIDLCDGVDNDDDGFIDEDDINEGVVCQIRLSENCGMEGVLICFDGKLVCAPGADSPAVCDGVTNDVGEPQEEPRTQGCQGTEEICDGVDNDCDGLVDEGLTTRVTRSLLSSERPTDCCSSIDLGDDALGSRITASEIFRVPDTVTSVAGSLIVGVLTYSVDGSGCSCRGTCDDEEHSPQTEEVLELWIEAHGEPEEALMVLRTEDLNMGAESCVQESLRFEFLAPSTGSYALFLKHALPDTSNGKHSVNVQSLTASTVSTTCL